MENEKKTFTALGKNADTTPQIAKMSEVRRFAPAEYNALKLINPDDDGTIHVKAFRDLRTQLMKRMEWRNFVCLVTSVASGGCSYVAANLAAAIALDKSKTALLLDANLYSPNAETLLPVPSHLGLVDYLDDSTVAIEDVVYASGVPRMRVIPAGTNGRGVAEKFDSSRMRELFAEIKNRYEDRYVIVDGPPVAEYDAEICLLAAMCDFVLLVVPYGKTNKSQLNAAIEKIGKERLAGVVFNMN